MADVSRWANKDIAADMKRRLLEEADLCFKNENRPTANFSCFKDENKPTADFSCFKDENKPKDAKVAKCECDCDSSEMRKVMDDAIQLLGLQESDTDDDDAIEELLMKQNLECAEAALAYYNQKEGSSFKLVEPMDSNAIDGIDGSVFYWFHVNFKAHDPNSPDSSDKLFFAEMRQPGHPDGHLKPFQVKFCEILNLSDPGVTQQCHHCPEIYHPATGYKVGVSEGWSSGECDEDGYY